MGPSGKGHCKLLYGDWGIDEEVELEEFHDYSSRSETDIVNVVEQRIWHSMEEGHFENLPGKGKPLDLSTNPHADPAEDTLYRILSKNGCAPEWVELNKEIRRKITEWRLAMKKLWADRSNHDDDSKWIQDYETLKPQVREINDMIFKAEFNCPCWFSTSTKKLIKRSLDPNPITRITISKVIGNEWFKKGYQSPSFETPDIDIDDVQAIFDAEPSNYIVKRREEKPVLMNAFELISTSQGLNLGSLFEKQMGLVKRETRFVSKVPANEILAKIQDAATPMGFNVQKQNYKLKMKGEKSGRKGHLAIATEVFEVAPSLYMVELRKANGDTLEFHKFYKSLEMGLKDIVWHSRSEEIKEEETLN